jgi:predicted transcriptional regulator
MSGSDAADILAGVHRRGKLLRRIGDGARSKSGLDDELGVSRSTIDRGVRELESAGLIERADDGYRQTLCGRLALGEYDGFVRRIEGLSDGVDLLAELPIDAELDLAMLAGATVIEAERSSPHKPVEALYGLVESASSVRGFAPAVHPQQVATYSDRIEAGMDAELVLTTDVIERMVSTYAGEFQDVSETGRVSVLEAPDDLPYSLTIARTDDGPVAALMVYADGRVSGCVINDSEVAVEWARDRYERERERAVRLA